MTVMAGRLLSTSGVHVVRDGQGALGNAVEVVERRREVRERPRAEDSAAGVVEGVVDIRRGGVNVHQQAGSRARHLLEVKRRFGLRLVTVAEDRSFVAGRQMATYWSPRKPDCSRTNRASLWI